MLPELRFPCDWSLNLPHLGQEHCGTEHFYLILTGNPDHGMRPSAVLISPRSEMWQKINACYAFLSCFLTLPGQLERPSAGCYSPLLLTSCSLDLMPDVPFSLKAWLHSRDFLVLPLLFSVPWRHAGCLSGWFWPFDGNTVRSLVVIV